MMDSKNALQYLLSFIIVLANVEINFGYHGFDDDLPLHEVGCRYSWNRIVCHEGGTMEEQISRLKELYPLTLINLLFTNKHHYNFEMTSKSFNGLNIRSLTFSVANISKFTDDIGGPAFVGQENYLEELRIFHCNINSNDAQRKKNPFSLGHLRKLKNVEFFDNDIQSFGNGIFDDSSESPVETVDFTHNKKLAEFGDRAFANLGKLKVILLRNSLIKVIKRSMFPNPASYLTQITLIDNQIETFEPDIFENMPMLKILSLQKNNFQKIDEATFKPIWPQLTRLSFDPVSCEEDDIRWMVKIRQPLSLNVYCEGKNYVYLEEELEKMRKEIQ